MIYYNFSLIYCYSCLIYYVLNALFITKKYRFLKPFSTYLLQFTIFLSVTIYYIAIIAIYYKLHRPLASITWGNL